MLEAVEHGVALRVGLAAGQPLPQDDVVTVDVHHALAARRGHGRRRVDGVVLAQGVDPLAARTRSGAACGSRDGGRAARSRSASRGPRRGRCGSRRRCRAWRSPAARGRSARAPPPPAGPCSPVSPFHALEHARDLVAREDDIRGRAREVDAPGGADHRDGDERELRAPRARRRWRRRRRTAPASPRRRAASGRGAASTPRGCG